MTGRIFVGGSGLAARSACDVVVIGSGAGGAVAAAELAESGLAVTVLEEGPHRPTQTFTHDDLEMGRVLYRDGGGTAMLGRPMVRYNEGRCVGGSTVVNGGMSWRTPERVLERWRDHEAMPGLSPEAMEPWFERVERFLSASVQDPDSVGRDQHLMQEGARRLGWRVVDSIRAQVHCGGCNRCVFGCPTGAKQSTLVSYLPRALSFGADIHADCRADRIRFRGKQAVGVQATVTEAGGHRRRVTIDAAAVVVACGAIHTPALLTRSRVRSPSGRIGHGLTVHPGAQVTAVFDELVEGWKGVHQAYQVREFEQEGIVLAAVNLPPPMVARSLRLHGARLGQAMEEYPRMVTAGVLVEDTTTGRVRTVRGVPLPSYQATALDGRRVLTAVARLGELLFEAGATRLYLPFGLPAATADGPDELRAVLAQSPPTKALELFTVHLMGTAAMGGDPLRHVCDPYGRMWDTAGLYVADASLFPSPIGVNPMESVMALSSRCAAAVARDLGVAS